MTFFRSAAVLTTVILLPAYAAAQGTAEQRAACTGDAFQFCGSEIPDATKVEVCLRKNIRQISPACRSQFNPRTARARTRVTPVADHPDKHQVYY